ncbi:hypothetical protein B0H15DRAFT_521702 [Mycena belliarum]|uniref:Uncharacterized protein n=1 Tax=Mycena belliarum TaxID=1033014 RepID=A0AAD6TYX1_9AGAR|nr:hypothetical protein B0H15DRAFT_521702 [Mycena belliae]
MSPGGSPLRARPPPLRIDHLGINPGDLVGKVLKSVRRSDKHPSLTLVFADGTRVQVMVDGYDPVHKGVPKALEMDPSLAGLFAGAGAGADAPVGLTVADCALITLSDKAFARTDRSPDRDAWDQHHLGVAFKFAAADSRAEGALAEGSWHCVWAILQDHDAATGECVFRTYDDVYLEHLQRSPRKARHRKKSGPSYVVP